ncbi:MAG: peptide deformylase [Bacteroidales bacterium]|nr:peptide deformylase [Bacteroidales bacterium]
MIQPIYLYGSEVLRQKAEDLDLNDKEYIAKLITDLKETLVNSEGVGLAAPQIGVSKKIVIVDGTGMADVYDYLADFRRVLINPVILSQSEETCTYNEGCLSIPGIYADVDRPVSMTVEYYDENLQKVTETFDRFGCRMVQHELSHLEGTMFVDLVAPIRKKIIAKKLLRISQGMARTHYNSKIK